MAAVAGARTVAAVAMVMMAEWRAAEEAMEVQVETVEEETAAAGRGVMKALAACWVALVVAGAGTEAEEMAAVVEVAEISKAPQAAGQKGLNLIVVG